MKLTQLKTMLLISFLPTLVYAHNLNEEIPQKKTTVYQNEDTSLRFHAQWKVDPATEKRICKTYGPDRIDFDKMGHPHPHGLSPGQRKRWERLYTLCMSDGCYYCDADEGSCELGTCGLNNEHCKPYLGREGQPVCGKECADYAFKSILICNDLS